MGQRKRKQPGVELTTEQFCGATIQLLARLRDHIERLDSGVAYAADDIAVVLRALIGSGRGNDVLGRLADRTRVPVPSLQVSRAPSPDGVSFAVGSLPVAIPGADAHGARALTSRQWMQQPVAVIQAEGTRERFTWSQFLAAYASKWGGAHLDSNVPHYLHVFDLYGAAGLGLSGYLLRSAGVAAWAIGQRILVEAMRPDVAGQQLVIDTRGGTQEDPRDMSERGQLQYLDVGHSQLDLLWYVSGLSSENNLLIPGYDVRYAPPGSTASGESEYLTQRVRTQDHSYKTKPDGTFEEIRISARILTYQQVQQGLRT